MTMWTSPEAINAELRYRRESLTRSATLVKTKRRRWGKRRGQAVANSHVTAAAARDERAIAAPEDHTAAAREEHPVAAREEHGTAAGREYPAAGRAGQNGGHRARPRQEATVPAQRASGERPVTKQPA